MVVPKSGGCCCGPAKAPAKKPTTKSTSSTTKKSTEKGTSKKLATKSTSSTSSKQDEALKKRLKKLLGKDGKMACASRKGNSESDEADLLNFQASVPNGIQQFILNTVKKEMNNSKPFNKIDKNAKSAARVDATPSSSIASSKKSSTTVSKKSVVKEPAQSSTNKKAKLKAAPTELDKSKAVKKPTTKSVKAQGSMASVKNTASETSVKTVKPKKSAETIKSDISLKKVKSDTSAKKSKPDASIKQSKADTSAKKKTATEKKVASTAKAKKPTTKTIEKVSSTTAPLKRKTTEVQKKNIPAKKPRPAKKVARKPAAKRRSSGSCCCNRDSSTSGGCDCDCGSDFTTTSTDFDDDESEELTSFSDDFSDSDDDSDMDTSGCSGGAFGGPPGPMNGKSRRSKGPGKEQSTSGSWETQSDFSDDQNYTKKAKLELDRENHAYDNASSNKKHKERTDAHSVKSKETSVKRANVDDNKKRVENKRKSEKPSQPKDLSRCSKSSSNSLDDKPAKKKIKKSETSSSDGVINKELKSSKKIEKVKTQTAAEDLSMKPSKSSNKKSHQNVRSEKKSADSDCAKPTVKSKIKVRDLQSLVSFGQNGNVESEDVSMESSSENEEALETWFGNGSTSSSDDSDEDYEEEEEESGDSDSGSNGEYLFHEDSSEELEFSDDLEPDSSSSDDLESSSKSNKIRESKSTDSGITKAKSKSNKKKQYSKSLVPYGKNGGDDSEYSGFGSEHKAYSESWFSNCSTIHPDYGDDDAESDVSDSGSSDENWYDEETSEELEFTDDEEENETDTSSSNDSEDLLNDYSSSMDEDYELPEHIEEDILIRRGEAKMHDATEDVGFNSEDSTQIFEIPNKVDSKNRQPSTKKNGSALEDKSMEKSIDIDSEKSSDSCPKLVPISSKANYDVNEEVMECSSDADFESSDASEDDSHGQANYEPEIIQVSRRTPEESSTLNDIGLLQTKIKKQKEMKLPTDFISPLEILTQPKSNFAKYNVISVGDQKEKAPAKKTKTKKSSSASSPEIILGKRNDSKSDGVTNLKPNRNVNSPLELLSHKKVDSAKCNVISEQDQSNDLTASKKSKSSSNIQLSQQFGATEMALPNNPLEVLSHKSAKSKRCNVISVSNQRINEQSSTMQETDTDSKPISLSSNKKSNKRKASKQNIGKDTDLISQSKTPKPMLSKLFNSLNTYQVLLLLKTPIYFHGTLKVTLLNGGLNILGYNFQIGETKEVYSPRGNNLLSLKPVPANCNKDLFYVIKSVGTHANVFLQPEINELVEEFDASNDAIVLLERNDASKKVDMIRKYMKENVFPRSNVEKGSPFYHSEYILRCRFYHECFNSFRSNPEWDRLHFTESTKLMIVGGKGVGKSTYLRYIINSNLHKFQQFLLIDLDIGQPEIFAPQTVSATIVNKPLLGPGYFYDLAPVKSYLYGDVNVILSPITYLACVKKLLEYCAQENRFNSIPWVVNTMGYNKGFGGELISVIIEHLQPTDVVQFESPKDYNNFDYPMSPEVVRSIPRNIYIDEQRQDVFDYKLIQLKSVAPSQKEAKWYEWIMKPKEIRLSMILSMMGNILSDKDDWLTDVKPYRVLLDDLNIICVDEENLSKAELLDVVNANLVYLCKGSKPALECFGIGIVRGIDKFNKTLYLLSSVPPKVLANVNTIAICNIPLPTSVLLNQGPKIKGAVPYTYNTQDTMTSKHVPDNVYRPINNVPNYRSILLD